MKILWSIGSLHELQLKNVKRQIETLIMQLANKNAFNNVEEYSDTLLPADWGFKQPNSSL
ncbi:hypothetical protein OGM63_04360 [Plectonema radiosum NIES-515]|uniref:Uncharacterized protein n=1 Tax=Plectonema radiosum NIES-515 TaxID=2986073 RepID=A0ABT3AUG9_9CYAN|nr:hypothetical protein [Plectonema radiosum]MCV3212767.1 hypothetical protein [Plectonema radiosum NIES-515]